VDDNLINTVNFTPLGKLACGPSLNYAIVDHDYYDYKPVGEGSNSGHSSIVVKTPPVEASVSTDIQCGGGSPTLVLASTATPICCGAGHLVLGVDAKRKCRPPGIPTIGGPSDSADCGKICVREDGSNENAD
ncbi:hypothetical protein ACH5RR_032410, partial [Cinchona calisaya]